MEGGIARIQCGATSQCRNFSSSSLESIEVGLPHALVSGREPFFIVGAIAGGRTTGALH